MTRAEQHAQYFDMICDHSSHQRSPEIVRLREAAALFREMQAAIEGQSCACKFMSKEPRPESGHYPDCWKAPFLTPAQ